MEPGKSLQLKTSPRFHGFCWLDLAILVVFKRSECPIIDSLFEKQPFEVVNL